MTIRAGNAGSTATAGDTLAGEAVGATAGIVAGAGNAAVAAADATAIGTSVAALVGDGEGIELAATETRNRVTVGEGAALLAGTVALATGRRDRAPPQPAATNNNAKTRTILAYLRFDMGDLAIRW